MRLYVGAVENTNFRETVLMQQPLKQSMALRPALFYPTDYPDPFANTCYRQIVRDQSTDEFYVMTEDTKEPIQHNSIVEMRYEMQNESGWQWIPARIRHDKTEILHQRQAKGGKINYSKTMNFIDVAKSVWLSIHNPVTEYMISNGTEIPSPEELQSIYSMMIDPDSGMHKKYYEQNVSKADKRKVKSLVDFHNQYIKSTCLIKRVLKPHYSLLDIACGRGGDINKWMDAKAGYIFGIDIADNNILNPEDGAYERYVGRIKNMSRPENATKMVFAVGDSSKNIVTGEAGASTLDRTLMQSIFGKYPPDSTPPPYVSRVIKNAFHTGADVVACMFAIHYFFKSMETFNGLLQNLSETVKVGGHFIGCCFDGETIFRKLAPIETNFCLEGKKDDKQIWSIRKDYIATEFPTDDSSIGLPISVNFISIGSTYTEYLVSFPFLVEKLKTIGLELVESKMFKASYNDAKDSKQFYNMSESEEAYSFLNRWFIFKRIDAELTGMKVRGEIPMPPIPSTEELARSKYYRTFEKTIIAADSEYDKFIAVPSSDYSVLKPWHKEQVNKALTEWFPGSDTIKLIVDGTSHIGVDAIHFGKMYPRAEVHACEIVPEIAVALQLNIQRLGAQNVIPHVVDISLWEPEDISSWSTQTQVDILFVDPPWGGKGYDKVPKLDLYLEEELKKGQHHNPAKNIKVLLAKWLASGFVANVIIKVPKNFNRDGLPEHIVKEVYDTRKGKEGKLDYIMFWFKGTIFPPEMRTQKIQERISGPAAAVSEDADEKKEDDDPRVPYAFGPNHRLPKDDATNGRLWDQIMRAAQPSDITELPSTAGIWLDMGAPILLPDVIKGMDPLIVASTYTTSGDPAVFKKYIESYTSTLLEFIKTHPSDTSCFVYPTMDYYLYAMKLAFVATNVPKPIHAQFSKEGKIYKNILKKLGNLQNTPAYSNDYFAFMSKQSSDMYNYINSQAQLQQITYNEKLWLGAYDVFVRFIIDFRLHYDVRFQRIVYFIKEKNKRLIYTSNDSANQPFRTRIGNMIASIINDLTLDSLQFVYDEAEIAAHTTIAAAITPAIEIMPVAVPAPVPAALPEIVENPPVAAAPVVYESVAPVLAAAPVAATSIAAAPVLAYEPVAAASSVKKGLSKGLSKGSLKKP
jgi:SAM-dependent methyltransferase